MGSENNAMSDKQDVTPHGHKRVLELDAGNTRLKWRVVSGSAVLESGYLMNDADWQAELSALLDRQGQIDFARASVVSGASRKALLESIISGAFGLEVRFACATKSFGGVTVAYEQAETFGVDRWLAMLAAEKKHPKKSKLVVDFGTALTVDVVDSTGCHQGGYIVPGLRTMAQALYANTTGVAIVEEAATADDSPGRNMEECVNRGAVAMMSAFINDCAQKQAEAIVCLTGGGGAYIRPLINANVFYSSDLVMDGLVLALP